MTNETLTTDHVLQLTNLKPGTEYHYKVGGEANGIPRYSQRAMFQTLKPNGPVKLMVLGDTGRGNLYRADATGSHPLWSTVGTIMYEEGLAVVKTPVIPRFGRDRFEVNLKGQQNIYNLRMSVPAEEGNLDLSVNPSFKNLAPSGLTADSLSDFTYITNVNFLDENLNVILKSHFSQAIVKRVDDRFVVRVKLDF